MQMQMRSGLFPTMSPLLLFIISTFIILIHNFPICHGVDDEQFTNCSRSYTCANREISYPFWGGERPNYCGYPGFELNCSGDAPEITMASLSYRVLEIDNSAATLTLVRNDYWQTLCPPSYANVTLDFSILTYASNTKNVSLYYECLGLPTGNALPTSTRFNCGGNISYYLTPELAGGDAVSSALLLSCNSSVRVPAVDSAVNSIETNISTENVMQVIDAGFGLEWEANSTLCLGCTGSGGTCGSQPGTTEFTCYCPGGPNATMCGKSQTTAVGRIYRKIIIGIGGSVAISILLICFFGRKFWLKKIRVLWMKETEGDQDVEEFIRKCGSLAPKRYSFSDVKKMTNSFKDKLGQGGFGQVYKGQLHDGRVVAVKVLSESKGNGEEFMNEVASISRTSHVNIVALSGFCYERTKRALIYEFMCNSSLDKFIYDGPDKTSHPLGWEMLYQIALGIARGLEYLHRGCNTRILHFDIKPHNILLDEDFCPKISDFGLAKLCQRKESIISLLGARGTVGYIAPEVFSRNFGGVSHKSDVYSYGMMVLEMVGARNKIENPGSGTSEIYFPHWIYKQLDLGVDLMLDGVMTEEEGEISRKLILVGLWCIQTIPSDRPSMNKAIEMLEGSLQSLQVPPKPFLSSPPRLPWNSSTTSS